MSDYSDNELLQIFQNEEQKHYAFNLIVKKYQKQVYWHVRRLVIDANDADDVSQDSFIKIWKALPDFREESQLYTWIYRIATNEALSFLRKKRNKYFLPIHDVEKELSEKVKNDNYFFKGDEIERKLQLALLQLPEKQRIVFNMRYFDALKYEDISTILGTSVGALKASYHLAAKKIEKFLIEN